MYGRSLSTRGGDSVKGEASKIAKFAASWGAEFCDFWSTLDRVPPCANLWAYIDKNSDRGSARIEARLGKQQAARFGGMREDSEEIPHQQAHRARTRMRVKTPVKEGACDLQGSEPRENGFHI